MIGLVLACCRLGGGISFGTAMRPVLRVAYSADRLFWIFKKLVPTAYSRMMGVPKGYQVSPQDAQAIAAMRDLLFPLKPRRDGAMFDGYISNVTADRFPLEQLSVPTLIISAQDDNLAPYRYALEAAPRIPGAKLVTVAAGGHAVLGHDTDVQNAIAEFVHELV